MDELISAIQALPALINKQVKDVSLPRYRDKIMRHINNLNIKKCEEDVGTICTICTEDILIGDNIVDIPCGHTYHAHCIYTLFFNDTFTCPLCRKDIVEEVGDTIYYEPTVDLIFLLRLAYKIKGQGNNYEIIP